MRLGKKGAGSGGFRASEIQVGDGVFTLRKSTKVQKGSLPRSQLSR